MKSIYENAMPRPWRIFTQPISGADEAKEELAYQVDHTQRIGAELYLLEAGGKCPATTGCGETSEANAALIVHAVNNIERLEAINAELLEKLGSINRITSPGNRTLDDLCRDMGYACDIARAAIASAQRIIGEGE